MSIAHVPTYQCCHKECSGFPGLHHPAWANLPSMKLTDTETGAEPSLPTTVAAFWTEQALYLRFTCADNHIVASMQNHDDPIYNEDVVEAFISENGDLHKYKEFEVSPKNVKFDALISNDLKGHVSIELEYDAAGWQTTVYGSVNEGQLEYIWELPFSNFTTGIPRQGDKWRFNCYRIDRGATGNDEYLAWSPTGIVDFHIPEKFGWLCFV